MGELTVQGMSNTAWAFARASRSDVALFRTLAGAVEQLVGRFNAQNYANTAWAFAMARQSDAELFRVLARAVV